MSWVIDRPNRRVINKDLGISLVEGKGRDGDIHFVLMDRAGDQIADFYSRSDGHNEEHNKSAPAATNFSAVVTVFGLYELRNTNSLIINDRKFSVSEVVSLIRDALIQAVGGYDLGFPKYVSIVFKDDWLT
uniref:Uncharacterized protein n=1 Tax=Caulobacter sp. (strain K31) TaxID=366602 RepID=B0T186_CAUSK